MFSDLLFPANIPQFKNYNIYFTFPLDLSSIPETFVCFFLVDVYILQYLFLSVNSFLKIYLLFLFHQLFLFINSSNPDTDREFDSKFCLISLHMKGVRIIPHTHAFQKYNCYISMRSISRLKSPYFTASNATSSAAVRSSTFSIPMERRIVLGHIP